MEARRDKASISWLAAESSPAFNAVLQRKRLSNWLRRCNHLGRSKRKDQLFWRNWGEIHSDAEEQRRTKRSSKTKTSRHLQLLRTSIRSRPVTFFGMIRTGLSQTKRFRRVLTTMLQMFIHKHIAFPSLNGQGYNTNWETPVPTPKLSFHFYSPEIRLLAGLWKRVNFLPLLISPVLILTNSTTNRLAVLMFIHHINDCAFPSPVRFKWLTSKCS